jgi:two-component system sensor histidine kinase VicK
LLEELSATTNTNNNFSNTDGRSSERNELVYGEENVVNEELQCFSNSKIRIDTCMDNSRPSLAIGIEPIKDSFFDAKRRGVELRYLTDITQQNISACKMLMQMVNEVRHLDGLKGNFIVSEKEYLAPSSPYENTKPASRLFYSNLKDIVEQHQYLFQMLWSRATPAQERIREIEEGIMPIRTTILENQDEIIREIKRINIAANKLSICSGFGGMQMSYNFLFDSYDNVLAKHRKGEGDGMRWITNIDKENVPLVKIFLKAGIRIKHIKNMPPLNFGITDKEVAITVEKMEGGKMSQSFLVSNEPLYTIHFNSVFDELWKNGIDAEDRIRDIEVGADWANVEVVPMSSRARDLYLNLVKKAESEIIIMFPTTNAFIRQKNLGVIQSSEEAVRGRDVKVRILMPSHKSTEDTVRYLKENYPTRIDIRYIEKMSDTKATILVVDRKVSLVMELRDDAKRTFEEAIGLSTYSNSRPGVLSYVSIFENLWKQTELYEQLKHHDIMQKEFINIAAHELKTPIQPILSLTEVLRSQLKDSKQRELLEVTVRNAKRLQQLTNDVLDVTRIEGRSLELHKGNFNLNDVVINAINDLVLGRDFLKNENVRLSYDPQDLVILADKERISQVISNLLSNAIKFSEKGTILVSVAVKDSVSNNNNNINGNSNNANANNKAVVVSVKDSGQGIDPSILPRLFTKFASKSHKGTGLGLFISKGIIEAHGGKIWGESNPHGRGATFGFSLPITEES